ncbi:MAG: cupin domain-containing protein [Actinomycetota bacterium]|nr:cupin domain-containing protein [Actinomycetota bacterium]
MLTQNLEQSPRDRRGGQVSYLLLGRAGELVSDRLAVTWVEGPPGSEQPTHEHERGEQAYVIVRGKGLMKVADERQEVEAGTLVYIRAGSPHSIRTIGDEPLVYVSATTPPFEVSAGRWSE